MEMNHFVPQRKNYLDVKASLGFESILDSNINAYSKSIEIIASVYDPMTLVEPYGNYEKYNFDPNSREFTIKFTIPHSILTTGPPSFGLYMNEVWIVRNDPVAIPASYVLSSIDEETTLATIRYKLRNRTGIKNIRYRFEYSINYIHSPKTDIYLTGQPK